MSTVIETPITVQNAEEAILNQAIFQVYYRQLGVVALHFGVDVMYNAASYLTTTARAGSVSWVVRNRFFQWNGLVVAPGLPDTPTMSLWGFGGEKREKNTVFLRKGWWALYLPTVAGILQNFNPPQLR